MLSVKREHVHKIAELLAMLHSSLTDSKGLLVISGRRDLDQYPAAVMAALVMLSGGEAIGYQGDTHLKGVLKGETPEQLESLTLDHPRGNGSSFLDKVLGNG